jgi:hypothetical protein
MEGEDPSNRRLLAKWGAGGVLTLRKADCYGASYTSSRWAVKPPRATGDDGNE